MKGIQFIVDEQGEKTAVVIDLEQWGQEWEAFYNFLLANSSSDENWLNQSPFSERLEQALEWNRNHSPQPFNIEVLEAKLQENE